LGLAAIEPIIGIGKISRKRDEIWTRYIPMGKDWDLPTLIAIVRKRVIWEWNLEPSTPTGVETKLNSSQRTEVKKRFADSKVTCIVMDRILNFTALILQKCVKILSKPKNISNSVKILGLQA